MTVLLHDPGATPYDLRFRLFGTEVRVHPLFWLVTAIFGWPGRHAWLPGGGLGDAAVFILACFVSILLHEFGHVWMSQLFGIRGQFISLYAMGGLAFNAHAERVWQRIFVSAAGPGIQLVLYAALWTPLYFGSLEPVGLYYHNMLRPALPIFGEQSTGQTFLFLLYMDLMWINLAWALFNLLPVWPLDGGWISREICQAVSSRNGFLASLWISLSVSALFAVNAILVVTQKRAIIPYIGPYFGGFYIALLMGMFAVSSWQAIQEENYRRQRFWDEESPWDR